MNQYAAVTAFLDPSNIQVNDDGSLFSSGDRILIYQAKGAAINTTNSVGRGGIPKNMRIFASNGAAGQSGIRGWGSYLPSAISYERTSAAQYQTHSLAQTHKNMTRALSLILLFAGAALYGQKSFEGTVTYTAKLEGAMAERMADMLRGRLPEKVVAYYLRNKSRVDFGETISITDADAGMVYQLNPALQTYQKSSIQGSKEQEAPKIKVSKTKEKTKILGYNAEKYIIEVSDEEGSVKMEVWATPDLRITESLQNGNPLALDSKVQGLPLRTSIAAIGVDLRIVFLATQINKTPPDPSLFEIPAGYVEEKADQE